MNRARCVATALAVMTALASVAGAAGPLLVNGAGQPLVWAPAPIPFHPDRGPLGALPNAAAVAIVAADFATWAAVPSASLSFSNAGPLPVDVTGANYMSYLGKCDDGLDPIIFDDDGSIIDDLFGVGASADVLGFASPECMTFVPPVLTEGSAVLNGRWLNGIQTDADPEITRDELEGVLVHEIGHYLNLDHSQVNLEEALDDDGANDDVVPTMFPYLVNGRAQRSLALDDVVAVSSLYPAPSFAAGSGGITGRVLRADGVTPFQGAYVVARRVGFRAPRPSARRPGRASSRPCSALRRRPDSGVCSSCPGCLRATTRSRSGRSRARSPAARRSGRSTRRPISPARRSCGTAPPRRRRVPRTIRGRRSPSRSAWERCTVASTSC